MGVGSIVASVAGGLFGASAASKAADAQSDAAKDQLKLSREQFNRTDELFSPYRAAGENALAAYMYELGLGPKPTFGSTPLQVEEFTTGGQAGFTGQPPTEMQRVMRAIDRGYIGGAEAARQLAAARAGSQSGSQGTTQYRVGDQVFGSRAEADAFAQENAGGAEYGGYTKTPGYDFRLKEGMNALEGSAAARGGLFSGASMKSLNRYGQDYATGEYQNFLNRLGGVVSSGQSAAGQQGAAGQNFVNSASNALSNMGNAQAAGAIGSANAINQGIGNALNVWQYQKALNSQPNWSGGIY